MGTLLTWRNAAIAFLVVLGVSGLLEALPYAHESASDLLFDAGLIVLVVAVSAVLVKIRNARRRR